MLPAEVTSLDTFITAITGALGDFSVSTLSTILVAALGIVVSLVVAWFAYRWIVRRANKALTKGKM